MRTRVPTLRQAAVAARLRASVWESIFTHDMRRYALALHGRMADVPTLIAGPSGSGKELVARAVGLSSYVPFNVGKKRFEAAEAELAPRREEAKAAFTALTEMRKRLVVTIR